MRLKTVKPPALRKDDTIGIMAPSSHIDKDELDVAIKVLESKGFNVYVHPQTYAKYGQSAGTAQEKTDALHDLFRDPAIRAVLAASGGNRAGWVLRRLDYGLIRKNPKIVMGYSDVTALLNAISRQSGLITFHGPTAGRFAKAFGDGQLSQCFNLLRGKRADMALSGAQIIRRGEASGPLVGGNLSLICSLMGTPYEPDFKGAILFLEDCGDELSHTDRMFCQLHNAKVFDKINGLLLGGFTDPKDTGRRPFELTLSDTVNEAIAGKSFPAAVMDAPFGHGGNLFTFPVGHHATLKARRKARLVLDGRAVAL